MDTRKPELKKVNKLKNDKVVCIRIVSLFVLNVFWKFKRVGRGVELGDILFTHSSLCRISRTNLFFFETCGTGNHLLP